MAKIKSQKKTQRGQAMAEYVMILTILTLVSAFALVEFKNALEVYMNRVIERAQNDKM